jgi:hypothetical protein
VSTAIQGRRADKRHKVARKRFLDVSAAVLDEKEAFNKHLKETKSSLYHSLKPEDFSQVFIPYFSNYCVR